MKFILIVLISLFIVVKCYKSYNFNNYARKYYSSNDNSIQATINYSDLYEGDVVEYIKGDSRELGAIIKVNRDKVILHPLCIRPSYENDDIDNNNNDYIVLSSLSYNKELELYYDDSVNSVSFQLNGNDNSIINVIRDGVLLTQRVIEDRISNPHAEHSEDCWLLNINAAVFANDDKYQLKLNIRLPEH